MASDSAMSADSTTSRGVGVSQSGGGNPERAGSRVAGVRRALGGVLEALPEDADEALDAAARCFGRVGVDHTSVPDIARELGVSRATVYRKLGTVDDIAWALFVRDLDRLLASADGRAGADRIAAAVVMAAPGHSLSAGRRHDEPYLLRELLPRLGALGHSDELTEAVARAVDAADGTGGGGRIGEAPESEDGPELRERLLDAAEACFRRYGLANTTVDDVVREAKVPRATLYRHAGGKAELLAAVLRREVTRFLAGLAEYLATCETFASQIVDGTLYAAEMGRREPFGPPLTAALLSTEQMAPFDAVIAPVRTELWAQITRFVAPLVDHAHATGAARPGLTAEDATEWLQRCIRSLIDAPDLLGARSKDERRAFLERMLLPAFVPDPR
jgi:AcrR family transcriptional regulator